MWLGDDDCVTKEFFKDIPNLLKVYNPDLLVLNSISYTNNKIKRCLKKILKYNNTILNIEEVTYYIAGDTDNIEEIQNIECDEALIPIGGTYTMDYQEAAKLANSINAKVVIPTHYGSIVGNKEDADKFKELVKNKEVKILIK